MTNLSPTALEAAAKAVAEARSKLVNGSGVTLPSDSFYATAAITAYLAQASREGWVMVPKEPTRGMVCAYIQSVKLSSKGNPNRGRDGKDEWMAAHTEKCGKRWSAMIAAAQNGG